MKDPMLYRIIRGPLTVLFKAVYKPTIVGKRYIPESGKIVLAGNHTHNLDCLLVGSATKRCVHFMAKDGLMKGIKGPIFKGLGIIPVNRRQKDSSSLKKAIEALKDENIIGIFPEGTINRTENIIMPFKYGAVKMAEKAESEIVPFVISGSYKPFERGIKINFLPPMKVGEDLEKTNLALMNMVAQELGKEGVKSEEA